MFSLDASFVESFAGRVPPFGFAGLGELVYLRTYSRRREQDGRMEVWYQTVERVVNGTYRMMETWIHHFHKHWNDKKAQRSARVMYRLIFEMKFLPPGRGLFVMGAPCIEERGLFAALNNCACVSLVNLDKDPITPFKFLMDMSMLGVGVGFDTLGAGKITITSPSDKLLVFVVPDSREGWVGALEVQLESFLLGGPKVEFDYSQVRARGLPIKGFGGMASGPVPLEQLMKAIEAALLPCIGKPISVTNIVDIMNLIGQCVIAGNVRRTAEIAFGPSTDEFLDLKDLEKNPQRAGHCWASNNSIFAEVGMDYHAAAERVQRNGEPGFIWLDNMRKFSRMGHPPDNKDYRACGSNPCVDYERNTHTHVRLSKT